MEQAKRIICMTLCFAMLAGHLPAPVHAEDLSQQGLCQHHQEHIDCSYAPAVDAVECGHQHDGTCYVQEENCIHVHDGCGAEDVPCEHICSEDTGCITVTLNCQHEHDNECGYVDAAEAVACDYVCAECSTQEEESPCDGALNCVADEHNEDCEKKAAVVLAAEQEAARKTVEEQAAVDAVQAMIDALPTLEEIQAKPMEDQQADYTKVQTAYDAYGELTEGQKALLPSSEEVFQPYFVYFNNQIVEDNAIDEDHVHEYDTEHRCGCGIFGGSCGTNLTWILDEGGILSIAGTGDMVYLSSYSHAPWYSQRTNIKSVIIEDGITKISAFAFDGCSSLTNISISSSVVSIGTYAFRDCGNLTDIYITDIGAWVNRIFSSDPLTCNNKEKKLYLNDKLVTELIIPAGITKTSDYAFYNCTSILSVIFPDSVTSMGRWAFSGCSKLADVSLSNNITSISLAAFESCFNLANITLPEKISSIGDYAFQNCKALRSINISNNVHSIGSHAFYGCKNLTDINIPDGVTNIASYAFYNCNNLSTIVLPDSIRTIDSDAFSGCSNLECLKLPDGITSIGAGAFSNCIKLADVNIPSGITSISASVFSNCDSLTSITIPDGIEIIGNYAFRSCSNLVYIKLPTNIKKVGDYAFEYCNQCKCQ